MNHLGDITKISGYNIEPVDVITFGSPCQDLSIAGNGAGLAGERSGLFMEAVRIIKEMRCATNGQYPDFAVWENVPGAFSSNQKEDFRTVLQELTSLCDNTVSIPRPPKKWLTAGEIMGDGYSIAWRVMDAQYWGVPQRRRRIALVVDFGGCRASQILFKPQSLRGDTAAGGTAWEGVASDAGRGPQVSDGALRRDHRDCDASVGAFSGGQSPKAGGIGYAAEAMPTLRAANSGSNQVPCIIYDCRGNGDGQTVPTLTGDHQNRVTDYTAICIQGNTIDRDAKQNGSGILQDTAYTLNAVDRHAVCMSTGQANAEILQDMAPTLNCNHEQPIAAIDCRNLNESKELSGTLQCKTSGGYSLNYINPIRQDCVVRRLTPLECERLQGYPDGWTDIPDVTDTPRYKALGNSIALPQWDYVLHNISEYLPVGATLGSLFDGIGGFPLVWEHIHGLKTAKWASEIEPFPVRVTEHHFKKER